MVRAGLFICAGTVLLLRSAEGGALGLPSLWWGLALAYAATGVLPMGVLASFAPMSIASPAAYTFAFVCSVQHTLSLHMSIHALAPVQHVQQL